MSSRKTRKKPGGFDDWLNLNPVNLDKLPGLDEYIPRVDVRKMRPPEEIVLESIQPKRKKARAKKPARRKSVPTYAATPPRIVPTWEQATPEQLLSQSFNGNELPREPARSSVRPGVFTRSPMVENDGYKPGSRDMRDLDAYLEAYLKELRRKPLITLLKTALVIWILFTLIQWYASLLAPTLPSR
ncbi:MAG: hypothetical protein ABWK01_03705 [Infirmifilum sp.]